MDMPIFKIINLRYKTLEKLNRGGNTLLHYVVYRAIIHKATAEIAAMENQFKHLDLKITIHEDVY